MFGKFIDQVLIIKKFIPKLLNKIKTKQNAIPSYFTKNLHNEPHFVIIWAHSIGSKPFQGRHNDAIILNDLGHSLEE